MTWRDMQHIVVLTARTANLRANDWVVNGVKRNGKIDWSLPLLSIDKKYQGHTKKNSGKTTSEVLVVEKIK